MHVTFAVSLKKDSTKLETFGKSDMELEDYLLSESEKYDVISKICSITDSWGISLRGMESFSVHFGLNRFYEIGETEFIIVNDEVNNYCGKFLFVFKGQTCPTHYHKSKHETFFVLKGTVKMLMNEKEKVLEQGDTLVMDRKCTHCFTGLTDALLLEVSNASLPGDSFFENRQIGRKGKL